jgi:tetratricopeptide (TPR) repeat protein
MEKGIDCECVVMQANGGKNWGRKNTISILLWQEGVSKDVNCMNPWENLKNIYVISKRLFQSKMSLIVIKKIMKVQFFLLIIFFFILTFGGGCKSTVDPHEENISGEKLFQMAYEETDNQNYEKALLYYTIFQERFPEDIEGNLWASYEIAFLYHKMGNDKKAIKLFDELFQRYNEEDADFLPQAPKILAEKVVKNIGVEN